MVSVLNVGAADASNGKSEATISPRMMNESGCGFGLKEGSCVCLRLRLMNKRNLKEGWAVGVKTVVYAAFEMIVDDEGVVDGRGRGRATIQELPHHPQPPNSEAK